MKSKINFWRIGLYIALVIILAIAYSLLIKYTDIPNFCYINSTKVSVENLMLYTWQGQITISVISISLTSLIIGNLERKICGQSIKNILMINKKWRMTYLEKIFFVIILAVINLWAIIFNSFPAVVVIFLGSVIGILDLIIDSYNVIFNIEKYKIEMEKYVARNIKLFNNGCQTNLVIIIKGIRENIESCNYDELKENLAYVQTIMKGINEPDENLKEEVESIFLKSIDNIVKNNCIDRLNYIIEIITFKLEDKNLLYKGIDYLVDKGKYEKTLEVYIQLDKDVLKILFQDLEKIPNVSDIQIKYFKNIYNSLNVSGAERIRLVRNFLNLLIPNEFDYLIEKNTSQYIRKRNIIYQILKFLIEKNDKETFSLVIDLIYYKNSTSLNLNEFNRVYEIVITINIFLYYIITDKVDCQEFYKEQAKEFLNYKQRSITRYKLSIKEILVELKRDVWKRYKDIRKQMELGFWEYMPVGKAKFMTMGSIVDEFFLFYSIAIMESYDYRDEIQSNFSKEDCERILENFDNKGYLNDKKYEVLKQYYDMYSLDKSELDDKVDKVFKITNNIYAMNLLRELKENYENISSNLESELIEQVKVCQKIRNNLLDRKEIRYKEDIELLLWIDLETLSGKVPFLGTTYQEIINKEIYREAISKLLSGSDMLKLKNSDSEKIDKVFDIIKKKSLDVVSIISDNPKSDILTYNTSIEKIDEWTEFIKDKIKISLLERIDDRIVLVNQEKFNMNIEFKSIDILELEDGMILERMQLNRKEERYIYNTVNSISVNLNELEAKEYLRYKYKYIKINAKVDYNMNPLEILYINYSFNG